MAEYDDASTGGGGDGGEVVERGCFGRSPSPSRIFRIVNARNDIQGIPLAFGPANLNHAFDPFGPPVQAHQYPQVRVADAFPFVLLPSIPSHPFPQSQVAPFFFHLNWKLTFFLFPFPFGTFGPCLGFGLNSINTLVKFFPLHDECIGVLLFFRFVLISPGHGAPIQPI
jgi:hypothetical protein